MVPRAHPALLALLLACACSRAQAPPDSGSDPSGSPRPRLVLLIATCTLGKDVLEPYDPGVCWTPNLAAVARESVVFERHETEAGQSGCDYAALLTGTQADRHGIYHHPTALAPESTTLAEVFAAAGWDTYFWFGHPMASPELGYDQGVPREHCYPFALEEPHSLTPGDAPSEALFERLGSDARAHAFVQLDFTVTHVPYPVGRDPRPRAALQALCPTALPPLSEEEFQQSMTLMEAHLRRLQWDFDATVAELGLSPERVQRLAQAVKLAYVASVQQLDAYVGEILVNLQRRGLLEETLFVFTADHGEVLHRPGLEFHWTHGMQLAPECLGVPWIVRAPGLAPQRYSSVTRSIDVFPTIAGLAGVKVPPGAVEGRDLARALRGEEAPPRLVAWSHTSTLIPKLRQESREWGHFRRFYPRTDPELIWVRARDGDAVYKLRNLDGMRWGMQVFDLARDPYEQRDLADDRDASQAAMRRELEGYKQRLVDGFEHARLEERAGENALERLRGLGYAR